MSRWIQILGLSVVLSAGCGATVNVEEERAALLARDREWSAASADTERFVSFFSADGSLLAPGMPIVTGRDGIRAVHAEMAAAPGFSVTWEPTTATVSAAGDLGQTMGSYQAKSASGSETGKYVTTWRKEDGQWMVTADIFNPDAEPSVPHAMVVPNSLKWGPSPPGLPAGAEVSVVSGDPSQAGPFVLRARVPAGYRVPPHWHPTTEHLTILTGTVALGMGEKWDEASMTTLAAGGFATMPAEMRHAFLARTAATFQVHATGPFTINYVNPADDPRRK